MLNERIQVEQLPQNLPWTIGLFGWILPDETQIHLALCWIYSGKKLALWKFDSHTLCTYHLYLTVLPCQSHFKYICPLNLNFCNRSGLDFLFSCLWIYLYCFFILCHTLLAEVILLTPHSFYSPGGALGYKFWCSGSNCVGYIESGIFSVLLSFAHIGSS